MNTQSSTWPRLGKYLFAAMFLALGILVLVAGVVDFLESPTTVYVASGVKTLSYDSLGGALLGCLLSAFALAAIVRIKRMDLNQLRSSCSWPHWFLLLVLLFLALPVGIRDGNFARIQIQGAVCVLFCIRWAIAAFRKERNRLWILYSAVAVLLYPALNTLASRFMQ